MNYKSLKSIIEGLLFLSGDEGLSIRQIAEITEQLPDLAARALEELKEDYVTQKRGLQVVQIAGNYRLATLPDHASYFNGWLIHLHVPSFYHKKLRWRHSQCRLSPADNPGGDRGNRGVNQSGLSIR